MTFSELRELVNKMDGLLANMAHQLGLNGIKAGTARLEVEAFMMYLSAADGKVDWEEAMALTEVCGEALNPDQITSVIRSQNIYTVEFERKIPMTLQILVFAENAYRKQGVQVTYSAAVIDLYRYIGLALMEVNHYIPESQKNDFNTYIHNMEVYREQNADVAKSASSGFIKKG